MRPYRQQGIALVMALIMLLMVTILGVSAVRMSGLDTQVAGNSMYASLVFQGAESALNRASSDLFTIEQAVETRNLTIDVPNSYFDDSVEEDTVETVTAGVELKSSATVVYQGSIDTPPINGIANDSEFEYQVVQISGTSRLISTAARDNHIEGMAIQKPPSN